jgi:hypothetical protein
LDQNFLYLYKQLTGKSAYHIENSPAGASAPGFLAGLMDDNHTVVLNALLEEIQNEMQVKENGKIVSDPAGKTSEMVRTESRSVIIDIHRRLNEFKVNWKSRLSLSSLFPFLKSNGWFVFRNGSYVLKGEGTREDARKLYQQTLQDMVVEGTRILALHDGSLARLQEKFVREWHRETVHGNMSRLLPLFEATVRMREQEVYKSVRNDISQKFFSLFTHRVNTWGDRSYATEEELYRHIAWPWYNPEKNENGFEGFMILLTQFIWHIAMITGELFQNRWRLFLRGIEQTKQHELCAFER